MLDNEYQIKYRYIPSEWNINDRIPKYLVNFLRTLLTPPPNPEKSGLATAIERHFLTYRSFRSGMFWYKYIYDNIAMND